jgi:hypothetical protein
MMFMNEMEIEDASQRWGKSGHYALALAVQNLVNLVEWTNRWSDGWAYWPKPCRAARQLQELIQGYVPEGAPRCKSCGAGGVSGYHSRGCDRPDVTIEKVHKALRPIKSFRTRHSHMPPFDIEEYSR